MKTPFASLQSRLRQLTSSEVEDNSRKFQVKLNETEESTESLVPWEPRFWYLVYKEEIKLIHGQRDPGANVHQMIHSDSVVLLRI